MTEKERMLHFVKLSLNLGKKKEQFISDADFDAYKNDPDFINVLE